jgi:FMN phosphatase YigB (HAD superfamily)
VTFAACGPLSRALCAGIVTSLFDTIRVVSWDVDGTLYARERLALQLALACSGAPLRAARELGSLWRYHQRVEKARPGGTFPETARAERDRLLTLERHWYLPALRRIGPRPGVLDLARRFASRKLIQIVTSDYLGKEKVAALGFDSFVQHYYEGEQLGLLKPNPEMLLRAARDLGVTPGEMVHIGDRDATDGACARQAGVRVLIIRDDFNDFRQLLPRAEHRAAGT